MRFSSMLFLAVFILSCSDEHNELATIDVADAFENQMEVKLSEFVTEVTYIPLETIKESYISDYPAVKVGDYIIVRNAGSGMPLLLFNRSDGKFIRTIGKVGRGPDEYSFPEKDYYNTGKNIVYTNGYKHNETKVFDITGSFLYSFSRPEIAEPSVKGGKHSISFGTYLDDENYVSFIDNYTGAIKTKLVIFNKDSIRKTFPNYLKWGDRDLTKNRRPGFNTTYFIRWNNNLYFKEIFNDTLFHVTAEELKPRLVFKMGKYGLSYEDQQKISPSFGQISSEYFLITDIDENSRFIFFCLSYYHNKKYIGFFDKKLKTTTICQETPEYKSALVDDINDFMPIIPLDFTLENEMIAVLSPIEILQWLKNNQDKATRLRVEMQWLNDLTETSNPVIVIAKCKN